MRMENDQVRIEFLEDFGGKIISFYSKENQFELAAQHQNLDVLNHEIDSNADFKDYAFGMDDCFPCINEETIQWKGRTMVYPNHGEIWRKKMQCKEIENRKHYLLSYKSPKFRYEYKKSYQLIKNGIQIHYDIGNIGDDEFPYIWTWHGLMRYEEDMKVLLPDCTGGIRNVLKSDLLGEEGQIFEYNELFHDVPKRNSNMMVKYYCNGNVEDGECGFVYPTQNVKVRMKYDKNALPYLGVWITAGGFFGDYNCALEPSNGFYDRISCAKENGALPVLYPGEVVSFELQVTLQEFQEN